ncbi:apyrase-like isoform X1 [Athalia rosae]|uniref:apyrase-like isoform X1 n=2 Tax=Athalia rosae TaxID=37344 RepID=UPI0020332110|nr:apyrase-like isoform X1 [Athalia rosae]
MRAMIHRNVIWLLNVVAFVTTLPLNQAFKIYNRRDPERNGLFELSVIHFSDFHARFLEIAPNYGPCIEGSENECVGGLARISTESRQLLNDRPNPIFLNAGDNFRGTNWYNVHRWNGTATFLNMLRQDAMTLGNHEFDDQIPGLVSFLKAVNVPVVVANLDDTEEPSLNGLYSKSMIIERNGTKIGIIGAVTSETKQLEVGGLKFLDELKSVNAEASILKNNGIDIIIVLSHCGLDIDRIIAARCPNVDLIVGGHSHVLLYSGTPPSTDIPVDTYPVVVRQEDSDRKVLIVHSGAKTKYLGNISVWFDTAGEIVSWDGNPIFLDNSVEQDPEILAALVPWKVDVDMLDALIVGSTMVKLENNCTYGECNIGNFITDAMVDTWVDKAENGSWTYAAIACINARGIKTNPSDTRGNITYSMALRHQSFDGRWDVVELLGSDLIQVLEHSVAESWSSDVFIGKRFLQWSGIRVTFNLDNKVNSRVTSLKVRCRRCQVPIYEDLVMDKWYRIVVSSFLTNGGDGYTIIKNRRRNLAAGKMDIDSYVKYIKKMSPIVIGIEGRITMEGKWRG